MSEFVRSIIKTQYEVIFTLNTSLRCGYKRNYADFIKDYFDSDMVDNYKNVKNLYIYLYNGEIFAMKQNSLKAPFINFNTLVKIFRTVRIPFDCEYVTYTSELINDVNDYYYGKKIECEIENLSKKYADKITIIKINIDKIEIIHKQLHNFDDRKIFAFKPIISIDGEKIIDELLSIKNQIFDDYNKYKLLNYYQWNKYDFDFNDLIF